MVDPVGDQVLPVSSRVFETIRAPVSQMLARNCVGLFLSSTGCVSRLESIQVNPFDHFSLLVKHPVPATYKFKKVNIPYDDFRTMVLDAVIYSQRRSQRSSWWLTEMPVPELREVFSKATTLAELHALVQFPDETRCMELL